jgi:hypothetical protein
MAKFTLADTLVKIFAAIGTVMVLLVTLISIFAPSFITNTSQQLIGGLSQYQQTGVDSTGKRIIVGLRPDVVAAQANVFGVTILVFAAVAGLALAGAFYWSTGIDARSVAAGSGHKKLHRWIALGITGVFCIFVGLFLPPAIFSATDKTTLARDFSWAAMPANSYLGGFLLGIVILLASMFFAWIFFRLLVKMPWQSRRNKVLKAFA